ncbi:hypothetical protein [Cupriavidus sp. AU9028]|uniref:hypothetical protein n=1 Tax=Cupriavidus sp. AU9028 TaxID=2871157 RepID=UPI001C9776BE|nr:hypothetical protein [Cupriavidus sp. AU9028]MBY4898400.1 hypothetical protein [Cupriavidus sp. AU9028]
MVLATSPGMQLHASDFCILRETIMNRDHALGRHAGRIAAVLALTLASGVLHARLPAPTEEQQRAADARKAKEAEAAKQQADALARVQDDLAARFGEGSQTTARTPPSEVSQKAAEVSPSGPHGGTAPSAEAHSGEAKRR